MYLFVILYYTVTILLPFLFSRQYKTKSQITFMLGYLVRNINDVELSVVSVERILEYMRCPQEVQYP